MAQDRGDQVMAVGEHIGLDPDVLSDDALDGKPPGVDLGPQALHDHANGIGRAARLGGASALGARGGYGLTPGEDSGAAVNTGGSTLPRWSVASHGRSGDPFFRGSTSLLAGKRAHHEERQRQERNRKSSRDDRDGHRRRRSIPAITLDQHGDRPTLDRCAEIPTQRELVQRDGERDRRRHEDRRRAERQEDPSHGRPRRRPEVCRLFLVRRVEKQDACPNDERDEWQGNRDVPDELRDRVQLDADDEGE
jgi:hypothetical protein